MALLQLSAPAQSAQPGQDIAQLYEAVQSPNFATCQHSGIMQLTRILAIDALYWKVRDKQGRPFASHCLRFSDGRPPELSEQQITYLHALPDNTAASPLAGPLFCDAQHPWSFTQRCNRTGLRHTLFIATRLQATQAIANTGNQLNLYLPHLINACYLNLLKHAHHHCASRADTYALYDAGGHCQIQSADFAALISQHHVQCQIEAMVSSTVEHTRFEELDNLLLRTTSLHCLIAVEVIQLPDSFQCLSPREKQICFYLSRALSNQEIAAALNSARKTIENQLTSIYRKLGIRSRTMLLHLINSTR